MSEEVSGRRCDHDGCSHCHEDTDDGYTSLLFIGGVLLAICLSLLASCIFCVPLIQGDSNQGCKPCIQNCRTFCGEESQWIPAGQDKGPWPFRLSGGGGGPRRSLSNALHSVVRPLRKNEGEKRRKTLYDSDSSETSTGSQVNLAKTPPRR